MAWLTHLSLPLAAEPKDFWDKLAASGTFIGGVLVTGAVAVATFVYNHRQSEATERQQTQDRRVNKVKTIAELIPYLSSGDPRQVEAALVITSELADEDLASRFAVIYSAEGGFGALDRLSSVQGGDGTSQAEVTFQHIINELSQSVVHISKEDSPYKAGISATGFFAGAPDLVVAPYYLFRESDDFVQVTTSDGESYQGQVVRRGTGDEDPVTILSVDTRVKPLPLSSEAEDAQDQVFVLGRTSSDGMYSVERCNVRGAVGKLELMLGGIRIGPGSAGSPVIGRTGSVVGMVTGTNDRERAAGGTAASALAIQQAINEVYKDGGEA